MRDLFIKKYSTDLRGTTIIKDQTGKSLYLVIGKWGLQKDVISVYSMSGEVLAEIRQLSLGLLPKFAIIQNHQQIGTISRSLGFIRQVIYIRGLNWMLVGNTLREKYWVYHGPQFIFSFSPEKNNQAYHQLTVANEATEPVALAVASVLDHWAKNHNLRLALNQTLDQVNFSHRNILTDIKFQSKQKRS